MLVEDAGVDDTGTGHVEAWYERTPDLGRTWTVSPAYGVIEGMEVSAALARDVHNHQTLTRAQLKWQLNRAPEGECQWTTALGLGHAQHESGASTWLNGVGSCPIGPGTLHMNLGLAKTPHESSAPFTRRGLGARPGLGHRPCRMGRRKAHQADLQPRPEARGDQKPAN